MIPGPASPHVLRECNWELTTRCSLRCLHCGTRAGKARDRELTLAECLGVAEDLVRLGCTSATLIGGEVFLFPGWERLARRLTDRGVRVNLVTNGVGLGEPEFHQIREGGLVNVGVSLDGLAPAHNRIRGNPAAFASALATLEGLRRHGIPSGVVTTLLAATLNDLEGLHELMLRHGVQVWQLQLASPMGNLSAHRDLLATRSQIRQVTDFIRWKNRDPRLRVLAADSLGWFDPNELHIRGQASPINAWSGCQAGLSSVFIDSVGNVKGCGALYADAFIEGNLREASLQEIWQRPGAFAYNRQFSPDCLQGRCRRCRMRHLCRGGCRSISYFGSGNLYDNPMCGR